MNFYGHLGLSLLLTVPVIIIFPLTYSIPIIGMMLITSQSPNKDTVFGFVSRRGITHTVWFAGFVGVSIFVAVYPILLMVEQSLIELGGFIPAFFDPFQHAVLLSVSGSFGVVSHIAGDVLITSKGQQLVKPFWPVSKVPWCVGATNTKNAPINNSLFYFGMGTVVFAYAAVILIRF